ncbi:MAG: helical backbone metal receptor [Pseudomonadota bacterium]
MASDAAPRRTIVDQTGYRASYVERPERIVSLVPSQTELLFNLGLADRLVACTRYCLHPAEARERLTVIGGTKRLDVAAVIALAPDLVIGNKEENDKETIEALRAASPTWLSDIADMPTALAMIESIGELCGAQHAATDLAARISERWASLPDGGGRSVAYLIWRKPFMAVGTDTFIDDVLVRLNWRNVFADRSRYPQTSAEELAKLAPDLTLLSSEPYPFTATHVAELEEAVGVGRTVLVDGEMFSWYGSRLLTAPDYFDALMASIDLPRPHAGRPS